MDSSPYSLQDTRTFILFFRGVKLGLFCTSKTRFPGVKVNDGKNIVKNFQNMSALAKEHEITAMAWGDSEENEVLLGLANQTVKVFDSELKAFTRSIDAKCGEGPIVGLVRYDGSLLTAAASGHVRLLTCGVENVLDTGGVIERMRHSPYNRDLVATGGKGNDLKLWNIGAGYQNTFRAKNVPHNSLELEVPVWVSDIAFLPDSSKIAVCTRYGQVRLYDPSAQRRPVLNIDIPEKALTSIAAISSKPGHVVVGTGTGHMLLVDLRYKGLQCGHYKGIVGSVREIACHKSEPYIVSISLDRYLRVHHTDTKKILYKEYLTSPLNCVLMRSDFSPKEIKAEPATTTETGSDIECVHLSEDDGATSDPEDMNTIFSTMETVGEKPEETTTTKKRKIIITGLTKTKKKKSPAA